MSEPARCVWCKVAVEGQYELGAACPHCGKSPLILEGIPEVRQEHSYGNEPTKPPDLEGAGSAWRVWRVSAGAKVSGSVGSDWLVRAQWAHPFWWWYMVAVVHLRGVPGLPPPHIQFPGATHELLMVSLDPTHPLPDVDDWKDIRHLEPVDQCVQFIVADDAQAQQLGDMCVRHIVFHGVSPDQDHREYWRSVVASSAEHLRLGGHPDQERDG